MISKFKTRVIVTLPKKQLTYLNQLAKKLHTTVSKLISSIILTRANAILDQLTHNTDFYDELLEIAHGSWID